MTRRLAFALALAATLAGCNLIPKQEDEQQVADAPPGTVAVPFNEAVDVPKDAQGRPIDKGDGPVLQALGSLAGVDLGKRAGGCTFQHSDGRDILITGSARAEDAIARGAVRTGGVIVMLQSIDPIGVDGLKAGAELTDGDLTVSVRRAAGAGENKGGVTTWNANLGVSGADGKQRLYSPGRWVCA